MAPQRGGRWRDHRRVINGILWRIENGAKCDQLPDRVVLLNARAVVARARRPPSGSPASRWR
ncbi:hypothetical protein [Actinoplanes teichomyceticus]|uniref:hypothetical protein n=1 Tax=Actinoplanes teichomyceticus TaxID=1867 RepID=UPI0035566632